MEYKDRGKFKVCDWRSEIYTDTGADYVLPDYNGDVRKILYTEAKVRPAGNFENGESVDFSGIIVYNMVYSDSENRINTVSFSSDYDFGVKCNSDGYTSSFADTTVSSYSMRLLGPRKISAKAIVSSRVIMENEESFPVRGTAFEAGKPEVLCAELSIAGGRISEGVEREYAEEILRLDGRVADEIEVVYSSAECALDSAVPENEGVTIKGTLRIMALIKCDGEPLQSVEKIIRIDESLPCEAMAEALRILPRASVSSVRCNVNADDNGCSLVANVIIDLAAESYRNESVVRVVDAYRCDCDTKNEYEDYKYYELATTINEKEELSAAVERGALEIENLREIICLGAEIKVTDTSIDDGVCNIIGEVNYSGVASGTDENGGISYQPFKSTVPFSKNVNINCQQDMKIKLVPSFFCTDATVSVDENNVYLGCKSHMKLVVLYEMHREILASCELVSGGEYETDVAKITVYYPESGETLFDIARRFHTTSEKISADNSTSRASVSDTEQGLGAKRLLIF